MFMPEYAKKNLVVIMPYIHTHTHTYHNMYFYIKMHSLFYDVWKCKYSLFLSPFSLQMTFFTMFLLLIK